DGRKAHLSQEEVAELANGDVYTAQEAKDNKLIDATGYLSDAVTQAATLAGIPANVQPHVEVYTQAQGLLSLLSASHQQSASGRGVDLTALDGTQIRRMLVEMSTPQLE